MALVNSLMQKPGAMAGKGPSPGDSLQFGVHTSLRTSSKHKQMVSSVLHLKKESVGHKSHPSAYNSKGAKAFTQGTPTSRV